MGDIPHAERMLVDIQEGECGLPSQLRAGPDHALYLLIKLDDPGPAPPRLALAGVLPSLHTLAEAHENLPHHPVGIGRHGRARVGAQEIPVEKAVVSHPCEPGHVSHQVTLLNIYVVELLADMPNFAALRRHFHDIFEKPEGVIYPPPLFPGTC